MVRTVSGHEVEALRYELLLKEIVATAEKLPPFPDIVWKVMPLIRNMAPVKEIEAVIKYDPAITARVLSLSQSPYFARNHSVNSLQEAIVILGNQKLIQVILTASASRYFDGGILKAGSGERELWSHCVSTAVTAEIIARYFGHKKALKIYLAALLHDIGKVVLNVYAKIYLGSTLNGLIDVKSDFLDLERRTLGVDHQAIGKLIAKRWRFPTEVIIAIGHHHAPLEAPSDHDVACIVYAANYLSSMLELGENVNIDVFPPPEEDIVFQKLGIGEQLVHRFLTQSREVVTDVSQFLSSDSRPAAPKASNARGRR
ncbi:MAG: HDOD domain-containing protein [Syntrophobacteraceae bacterium]